MLLMLLLLMLLCGGVPVGSCTGSCCNDSGSNRSHKPLQPTLVHAQRHTEWETRIAKGGGIQTDPLVVTQRFSSAHSAPTWPVSRLLQLAYQVKPE